MIILRSRNELLTGSLHATTVAELFSSAFVLIWHGFVQESGNKIQWIQWSIIFYSHVLHSNNNVWAYVPPLFGQTYYSSRQWKNSITSYYHIWSYYITSPSKKMEIWFCQRYDGDVKRWEKVKKGDVLHPVTPYYIYHNMQISSASTTPSVRLPSCAHPDLAGFNIWNHQPARGCPFLVDIPMCCLPSINIPLFGVG